MILMYAPDQYDYPSVIEGATFTIREGGKIVGHGVVEKRWKEESPA
jgi:translation elongation factor EF-Tu-like GTPase